MKNSWVLLHVYREFNIVLFQCMASELLIVSSIQTNTNKANIDANKQKENANSLM